MAGPPEDYRGVSGYERFKKAIRDPAHPEHEEQLFWIGGKCNPMAFDPKTVRFLDPTQRFQVAFCEEAAPKEWE